MSTPKSSENVQGSKTELKRVTTLSSRIANMKFMNRTSLPTTHSATTSTNEFLVPKEVHSGAISSGSLAAGDKESIFPKMKSFLKGKLQFKKSRPVSVSYLDCMNDILPIGRISSDNLTGEKKSRETDISDKELASTLTTSNNLKRKQRDDDDDDEADKKKKVSGGMRKRYMSSR